MPQPTRPLGTPMLQCEVCLKEIPASHAASAETEDYVLYFCGVDCYARWSDQERRLRHDAQGEDRRG